MWCGGSELGQSRAGFQGGVSLARAQLGFYVSVVCFFSAFCLNICCCLCMYICMCVCVCLVVSVSSYKAKQVVDLVLNFCAY